MIIGTDQNIDYLKIESFTPAQNLLDFNLESRVIPVITRPTNVTHQTGTHYPCLLTCKISCALETINWDYFG